MDETLANEGQGAAPSDDADWEALSSAEGPTETDAPSLGSDALDDDLFGAVVAEEVEADDTEVPQAFASGSFENLVDDFFDDAVVAPTRDEPEVEPEPAAEDDVAAALGGLEGEEAREMFGGIAAGYVKPVRQFHARLKSGPVSTEWVEICQPAIEMVARSASAMGLEPIVLPLETFSSLLGEAGEGEATEIDGALRAALLQSYTELSDLLPEAFVMDDDLDQKDSVIVHSLLRRVPDVGRVSLDKIFGAGITTIEMLMSANPNDLSVTTGIPTHLSERICRAVDDYKLECQTLRTYTTSAQWGRLIRRVAGELLEHHRAYRELSEAHSHGLEDARSRRRHRRARQDVALKLNMLLAEMGEVQLVDEIQRLPYENRIERVQTFVASLNGDGSQHEHGSAEAHLS